MNIQNTALLVQHVRSYTHLDTKVFEQLCTSFLELRKRKTFDLKIQNGLMTLLELHADMTTLSTFLLSHLSDSARKKVVIDSDVSMLLQRIDGLREITSPGKISDQQSADSVRKMFLALSKDFRVILVLMAIRYADLFELDQQSPVVRKRIARQTLEIFVPITGRLGIYTLKRKLEDRCFSFLSQAEYQSLNNAFEKRQELHEETLEKLIPFLKDFLESHGLRAKISGRVKGRYSTYVKLKQKGGGAIDEIYDLLALRVIVEKQTDCYTVLSLVNNHWQAIQGRFKDYIAMPKPNGYRSLHTAVLGMIPGSPRPVEIQIRTAEMHREAEFGIAAHWWYEEDKVKKHQTKDAFVGRANYQEKLQWVRNLVHLQDSLFETKSQVSFDFFSDQIFVMTLNGVVVELPKGATPLDFAYALSDTLGNHCFKAKVNGKIVPLNYELQNGDRVFVVKKMEVSPSLYWLSIVRTDRARNSIRKWLLEQGEDTVLDQGVRLVNRVLRQMGHDLLDEEYDLLRHYEGKELSLQARRLLLVAIGQGEKDPDHVVRAVLSEEQLQQRQSLRATSLLRQKDAIFVAGESDFKTKIAACCSPVFGNSIIGYVTRGGFISIHERSCKVLASLDSQRLIDAWWAGQEHSGRRVKVQVLVLVSMAHLLGQLSQFLKAREIPLMGFAYEKHEQGYLLSLDLQIKGSSDLDQVLARWKQVPGVLGVGSGDSTRISEG
ncbi:MAG: bifunctional (p)ppGpp synthetase/guanosine-3',5'-bis(diphosphate) 3'-pyrophosphohydrolase [Candidatus Altimarinota bacterium]